MKDKVKIARQLRKEQTKAEKKLWGYLRNRQFENLKFRRQHPIKDYIIDFFSEEYGIVIELDGEYHKQPSQREKDELRDLHLTNLGFLVLRFENDAVFKDIDIVLDNIRLAKRHQNKFAKQRRFNLEQRKKNRAKHLTPTLSSRRGSPTILSTKDLTSPQKSLALSAGLRLVEYNAIQINFLEFDLPQKGHDTLIFTSQNGVKAYLEHRSKLPSPTGEGAAFCVGEKTKRLLEENGFTVLATAPNAKELGDVIVKDFYKLKFLWLAGNQRRDELPEILNNHNVKFAEVTVYETMANPKKMETRFDGILFFSPSAVSSFTSENEISGIGFCIGNTTAQEIKKYTNNYIVANKPTIENVLVQAVKYFNSSSQTTTE